MEYLVESCAQNGHTSIRYIEKVGLSWHERGFKTAEEAKTQSMGYKKDISRDEGLRAVGEKSGGQRD